MSPVTVLCVYPDGQLPAAWFQVVRRLRSQAERAGLDVDVRLAPLSAVAPGPTLVVTPPGLADLATVAARAPAVTVPGSASGAALEEIMARLQQAAPARVPDARRTVRRRGFHVVPGVSRR